MKIFMAYSALILLLLLPGCINSAEPQNAEEKNERNEQNEQNEKNEPEKMIYDDGFTFSYSGADICMGEYIENIMPSLGPESDSSVSDSCTSEGMMVIYVYGGVEISAYAKTEADEYRIFSATFRDDSVATAEGICIGQPAGEMLSAYEAYNGDHEELDGFYYKYFKNGTALSFDVENDVVIGITYQLLII